MRKLLKAKATLKVTGAKKEYNGSITLCPEIMDKLGIIEYEHVEVNGRDKPHRISTYVLKGKLGQVELNGGAAQFFAVGDVVHLNFFHYWDPPSVDDILAGHDPKYYPKPVII